jgi:hypothetical protein
MPASQAFSVSFHRTQKRLLAARLDKRAFLAAPSKAGGVCVLSAHRLDTPPQAWRAADFCTALRRLEDEAAFHRVIEELAAHERQLAALDRGERPHALGNSPAVMALRRGRRLSFDRLARRVPSRRRTQRARSFSLSQRRRMV